jgi:hypothetical protein
MQARGKRRKNNKMKLHRLHELLWPWRVSRYIAMNNLAKNKTRLKNSSQEKNYCNCYTNTDYEGVSARRTERESKNSAKMGKCDDG